MSEEASEAEIRQLWPLHLLVWKADHKALDTLLQEKQVGRIRPDHGLYASIYLKQDMHIRTVRVRTFTHTWIHTQHDREQLDPRGRTPLHLAVSLGRVRCAEVLLRHDANTLAVNRHQWSGRHVQGYLSSEHVPIALFQFMVGGAGGIGKGCELSVYANGQSTYACIFCT